MKQDEIIEMARASGFMPAHDNRVKHFAKLVAAKERDACAKLCEMREDWMGEHADLIRARSGDQK
jgi:hypothetical protein